MCHHQVDTLLHPMPMSELPRNSRNEILLRQEPYILLCVNSKHCMTHLYLCAWTNRESLSMEKSYDTAERLIQAGRGSYIQIHQTREDLPTSCPKAQTKCFRCWKIQWVLPYYSSIFAADNTLTIETGTQKMPKQPKNLHCFNCPNVSQKY